MNMIRPRGKVLERVRSSLAGVSHRDQLFFAVDFLVQIHGRNPALTRSAIMKRMLLASRSLLAATLHLSPG